MAPLTQSVEAQMSADPSPQGDSPQPAPLPSPLPRPHNLSLLAAVADLPHISLVDCEPFNATISTTQCASNRARAESCLRMASSGLSVGMQDPLDVDRLCRCGRCSLVEGTELQRGASRMEGELVKWMRNTAEHLDRWLGKETEVALRSQQRQEEREAVVAKRKRRQKRSGEPSDSVGAKRMRLLRWLRRQQQLAAQGDEHAMAELKAYEDELREAGTK